MGSIPAPSHTVESEGREMRAVLNNVHKKIQKPPFKKKMNTACGYHWKWLHPHPLPLIGFFLFSVLQIRDRDGFTV
jgi:hypothetical protein